MPVRIPCVLDGRQSTMDALLDTGSQFCIMRPDVAQDLGLDPNAEPRGSFSRGPDRRYDGAIHRHGVRIPALKGHGHDLEAEPAWVVPADWEGPMVLGWTGFLATLGGFGCRPGLHPEDESLFYFLPAESEQVP